MVDIDIKLPKPVPVIVLMSMFEDYGLKAAVDDEYPDHILYETDAIIGYIAMRPHYCDRGRWLLHARSKDVMKLTIDWADGFPRYYYDDESLCIELTRFLEARGQLDSLKETPARDNGV